MASTTQLYSPGMHGWSKPLIDKLGIPAHLFPEVVPSGTVLGPLEAPLAEETGLKDVQVVATCSHDTGAAVAAVPASGTGWAYLSSGTWSLLGVESPVPVLTDQARALGFTNEIGYGGSIRLLTNIVGLWIVQECRRTWEKEGHSYDYDQLTEMASKAEPLRSLINPAFAPFGKPGNMPDKIADYCRATDQPVPQEPGQFLRCAFESLALLYRVTLEKIESLTGEKIARLHVVGGGAKNRLLNQFSASATGRTVLAGPVEATALGNVLIQALALGHIGSLAELRKIVADSFSIEISEPQDDALWESAFQKFKDLPSDL